MARTTAELVGQIVEVDEDISLAPFIESANALVTEICAPVTTYTAARLELIERWLSAHFYCIREERPVLEKADVVSERAQSKVDLGFDVTHYGQMAMRLDTNGGLAALNEEAKTGTLPSGFVTWLGTEDAEIID